MAAIAATSASAACRSLSLNGTSFTAYVAQSCLLFAATTTPKPPLPTTRSAEKSRAIRERDGSGGGGGAGCSAGFSSGGFGP
eukprot:5313455-Pleurochrysis_carterae.AAC.2